MDNHLPENDYETKHEYLIKKDRSLLYMAVILGIIIVVMAYLTLFADDPWKIFHKNEKQLHPVTAAPQQSLNKSGTMSDEEVKSSLIKFIEAFYYDQKRGYFDPPSYFAPITETFFNYHNLTYKQLKDLYWKRKEDMQNLHRSWVVSSLEFERAGSEIIATYWAKEEFFRPSVSEQQSMDVKYEMTIDENGKIVSLKDFEIRNFQAYKVHIDTAYQDTALNNGLNPAANNQVYDYTVVDEVPLFPGGQQAWEQYLTNNIRYPSLAKQNNVQGKVMVAFIVDKEGKVKNVKVRQGIGSGCDEEAQRVVQASPVWKPGTVQGKAVSTYCVMPVTFKLAE